MEYKKIICGLALIIGSFTTHAQVMTLQQCIETAIKNNIEVQQSELDVETADVYHQQAKMNLLPSITGYVGHSNNKGRSIDPGTNSYIDQQFTSANYSLNGNLILFNGLSLLNSIKQNNLLFDASKKDWQQKKDNTALSVVTSYLQVLANEDLYVIAQNQASLTKSQVNRLEILNSDGAIAPSLLTDLKGQLANDELTIVNAKTSVETAKLNLCQLMNVPYNSNLQLERSGTETVPAKYDYTAQQVYETAENNLPMVKAANLRTQSYNKAVKVAQGYLYPQLSLSGLYATNFSSIFYKPIAGNVVDVSTPNYVMVNGGKSNVYSPQQQYEDYKYFDQLKNNYGSTFTLGLNIPIFTNLTVRNKVKIAKIQEKNAGLQEQNTLLLLRQSVDQAHLNMTSAYDRYGISTKQVAAFKESFGAAEVRFNAGVGTSVDYLTAKNNIDRANINLTTAKYEYIFRTKVLDYYQGKQLY